MHVILDAVESRYFSDEAIAMMREAGVEVEIYGPVSFLQPMKINRRTHRRVLIIKNYYKNGQTGGWGTVSVRWRRGLLLCFDEGEGLIEGTALEKVG